MIVDHENSNPTENSGSNTNLNPAIFLSKKITFHVKVIAETVTRDVL